MRAMPSKIDSTSTLQDAEETVREASWRKVAKMDKSTIQAEIARLQEGYSKLYKTSFFTYSMFVTHFGHTYCMHVHEYMYKYL